MYGGSSSVRLRTPAVKVTLFPDVITLDIPIGDSLSYILTRFAGAAAISSVSPIYLAVRLAPQLSVVKVAPKFVCHSANVAGLP